jgi:NADH:ubiquinone oxidoreductase subunit 6 (subunit J)
MIRVAIVMFAGVVLALVLFVFCMLGDESGLLDVDHRTMETLLAVMVVCAVLGVTSLTIPLFVALWREQ